MADRITVEKLAAELRHAWGGPTGGQQREWEAVARRALELCGPTEAERELAEAALAWSGMTCSTPGVRDAAVRISAAAARVREERKPKPRYFEDEHGYIRDCNYSKMAPVWCGDFARRRAIVAVLNAAHERGELP